jgi:hypothetical protein
MDSGELAGPRVTRSGFLEGKSPYSASLGFVVDRLEDGLGYGARSGMCASGPAERGPAPYGA